MAHSDPVATLGPKTHMARLPGWWPVLPEPAASARCEACTWAWRGGRMQVKVLHRGCLIHARWA